ncbi:hypothetical protein AB2F28_23195 (plasmid) [Escherichia coli]
MGQPVDITGKRFGKLVALKYSGISNKQGRLWDCICDCGNTCLVSYGKLNHGATISCGCVYNAHRRSVKPHGMSKTPIYRIWLGMRERCEKPTHHAYKWYGGRGIKVCERWQIFENFYADMGERPEGMSLDRKDVNGDYEPENCRWATFEEQANNTRSNLILEHKGEKLTLSPWAKRAGIQTSTLHYRIKKGWPLDRALNASVDTYANRDSKRLIECRGRTQRITEWAREVGLTATIISQRILRGWDVEAAIFTPSKRPVKGDKK